MYIGHFRILNNDFLDKYPDVVPEQSHLVMLDSKSAVCMDNNSKYIKHTIHIARIFHLLIYIRYNKNFSGYNISR